MKFTIFFTIGIYFCQLCIGQKPALDTGNVKNWYSVENGTLSGNGAYSSFIIQNQPYGSNTLVLKSNSGEWDRKILNATLLFFTEDNTTAVVSRSGQLLFVDLGKSSESDLKIVSFKIPLKTKNWIAYQPKDSVGRLTMLNLLNHEQIRLDSITDYLFDNYGKKLLVKTQTKPGNAIAEKLQLIDLINFQESEIWNSNINKNQTVSLNSCSFDSSGRQLIFILQEKNNEQVSNSIWYYNGEALHAKNIANDDDPDIEIGLSINNKIRPQFNKNGKYILFQLKEKERNLKPKQNASSVDVWHYNDVLLQSNQLSESLLSSKKKTSFYAAINLEAKDPRILRLERNDEKVVGDPLAAINCIVVSNKNFTIQPWDIQDSTSYYLISLDDGVRIKLKTGLSSIFVTSPSGKYVIYYNEKDKDYYTYDIKRKKTINITAKINSRFDREFADILPDRAGPVGIAGWLSSDSKVLIYDNYDIWSIDPAGVEQPINITKGFGTLHKIKFNIVNNTENNTNVFQQDELLLLTAFDIQNKNNGFYKASLKQQIYPQLLIMDSACFYIKSNSIDVGLGFAPVKAKNANIWLLRKESALTAPNYYITSDFKEIKPISNIQPNEKYNWITSQLITWKQYDGKPCQGVLYKPENFDPQKKYPLIFNYYEQLSFTLNEYLKPGLINSDINIPYFVSNGYLVFVSDIHFSIANKTDKTNGMNAYNAIASAADYLSTFPWVDKNKMGMNGHSFGGAITNYLVTHTTFFAAAVESAGASDGISSYLSLNGPLNKPLGSRLFGNESGQGRMGATLWERPDLYLKSNSILSADKVKTPLLIMHNMKDFAVPWGQGVEMFLALQRLKKKVWMLQYDNGDHGVYGNDALDYTIRFTQFFNHYLKDSAAPVWMTQGIPARLKGIETGYALDSANSCGPTCKICKKINAIYNKEHGISRATNSSQKGEMKKEE